MGPIPPKGSLDLHELSARLSILAATQGSDGAAPLSIDSTPLVSSQQSSELQLLATFGYDVFSVDSISPFSSSGSVSPVLHDIPYDPYYVSNLVYVSIPTIRDISSITCFCNNVFASDDELKVFFPHFSNERFLYFITKIQ